MRFMKARTGDFEELFTHELKREHTHLTGVLAKMHFQVVLLLEDMIAFGTRVNLSLSSRLLRALVRLLDMLVQVASTGERLLALVVGADERFLR